MRADETLAILIADVCGTTALYERCGATLAFDLVVRCVDALAASARAARGEVLRSRGDDVLCTFRHPAGALAAARDMVGARHAGGLRVHAGAAIGPVLRARGEVFGTAVNLAARMLALAGPGEVIATEDLVWGLGPEDRRAFHHRGIRRVRGMRAPLAIFSLDACDGALEPAAVLAGGRRIAGPPPLRGSPTLALALDPRD